MASMTLMGPGFFIFFQSQIKIFATGVNRKEKSYHRQVDHEYKRQGKIKYCRSKQKSYKR